MSIKNMLDVLAEKRGALDCTLKEIEAAIPLSMRIKRDALETEIAELEGEIKGAAKFIPPSQAHTLVGKFLQLVWTPGGKKVNEDRLADVLAKYGVSEEDAASIWDARQGYWSIRKRGK